jgi:chromosome segregation ATPase
MPALNLKLWLYGGLAVALFGLVLRFDYLSEKVESQKVEIAQKTEQLNAINETLDSEREALRVATENRAKYYLQLESAENEIKTLRARDAAGLTKLRVNATCPTIAADRSSDNQAAPELTADARQAYWDLRREMTQCPAQLNLCIKTLQDDRNAD